MEGRRWAPAGRRPLCDLRLLLVCAVLADLGATTGMPRSPFHDLRTAPAGAQARARWALFSPCLPLFAPVAAGWRACTSKVVAVRHELATFLAFAYEHMDALATNRDPSTQTWKQQHDRPAPVEPPWEDFSQVSVPCENDLVVPSWRFETVKDAVEASPNGARVYCRKGDHHWDGKATVRGASHKRGARLLRVVGEAKARLWGRWSISRLSSGIFSGVVCAYETEGVGWPCVLVRGDPWLFDSCQLRAAGAYSVMCAKDARATLRRCGVGGMGGGPRRAICAVIVMDSSWCLIQHCQVEDTDYTHPGVRLIENGHGRLENSILQRNGYGVAVDNNAKMVIFACTLRDNNHAAFMAGWEAGNAEMEVRQCTVYGRVWHTIDRPGSLSECDNRFTVSSMTEAALDIAQDRYHEVTPSEAEEDRSWHYGRNPGRKGYTASPDLDGKAVPPVFVGGGARARHIELSRALSSPNLEGMMLDQSEMEAQGNTTISHGLAGAGPRDRGRLAHRVHQRLTGSSSRWPPARTPEYHTEDPLPPEPAERGGLPFNSWLLVQPAPLSQDLAQEGERRDGRRLAATRKPAVRRSRSTSSLLKAERGPASEASRRRQGIAQRSSSRSVSVQPQASVSARRSLSTPSGAPAAADLHAARGDALDFANVEDDLFPS